MASEDDIDYMSDSFLESICGKEDIRPGLIKSHAEKYEHTKAVNKIKLDQKNCVINPSIKQKEIENRDLGLSKPLDSDNVGFKMFQKLEFQPGSGLGRSGEGRIDPVDVNLKSDRQGLGRYSSLEEISRMQAKFWAEAKQKNLNVDDYRQRKAGQEAERRDLLDLKKSQGVCWELDSKELIGEHAETETFQLEKIYDTDSKELFEKNDLPGDLADDIQKITKRKVRLTTAERKRALKARLKAKNIPWDPRKFSGNKHKYKKKVAVGSTSAEVYEQCQERPNQNQAGAPARSTGAHPEALTTFKVPIAPYSYPSTMLTEGNRKRPRHTQPEALMSGEPARTFRDALPPIHVAVFPASYPESELTEAQAHEIELLLWDKLEDHIASSKVSPPCFKGTHLERGAMVVICKNKFSKIWLLETIPTLRPLQGGVQLIGEDRTEVQKASKVLVRIPGKTLGKTPEYLTKLLDAQNPALRVSEWRMISSREDDKGTILVFLVFGNVLESVKAAGGKAHVGIRKASLLVLQSKDDAKGASKPTSQ